MYYVDLEQVQYSSSITVKNEIIHCNSIVILFPIHFLVWDLRSTKGNTTRIQRNGKDAKDYPKCRPLNPMNLSPITSVIFPGQHCWCCISLHLLSTKYGTNCILGTVCCTRAFGIGHFISRVQGRGAASQVPTSSQFIQHWTLVQSGQLIGLWRRCLLVRTFTKSPSRTSSESPPPPPPPSPQTKCHQTNQDQSDVGRRTWRCYRDISLHSSTLHCLSISIKRFYSSSATIIDRSLTTHPVASPVLT